jgi:hypothetical protein
LLNGSFDDHAHVAETSSLFPLGGVDGTDGQLVQMLGSIQALAFALVAMRADQAA